jgi:hypothetical protein
LSQVVNAEFLLQLRYRLDVLLESIAVEQLVLFLLELLALRVVFMPGDDLPERGKKDGILAGLRQDAALLMLLIENAYKLHQLVRLAEAREEIVFFQLLVIILNERPDQLRG